MFIRQAMPLCERSSTVSCFILDDSSSIIYDEVMVHSGLYSGGATFLGRSSTGVNAARAFITRLLKQQGDFFVKRECEDYFVVGVETRRFYSVSDCLFVVFMQNRTME